MCNPACGSDNRSRSRENERLTVSAPERTILDALVISPDLPAIQARAQVVLLAAEGREDDSIAAELSMRRQDVIRWRKRFEAQGIRGLWDPLGSGPKKRVSPEQERALLWEVLYDGIGRLWSTTLLAKKHGLSRAAVNRIFAKHGIVRGQRRRIDLAHLKVFADPLFGVTVSGIAGLYYGTSGVLALATTSRAFSDLPVLAMNSSAWQVIDGFLGELGKLAELRKISLGAIAPAPEQRLFLNWLEKIEDRRELQSEIHLLTDWPNRAPQGIPAVRGWLAEHPHFKMHYAPIVVDLFWLTLVQRCFAIIATLPVQGCLVDDVKGMAKYLADLPDEDRPGIILVTHTIKP